MNEQRLLWCDPPCAQVTLLALTPQSEALLAQLTRGYTGIYAPEPPESSEWSSWLADLSKTKLQTPLEFIHGTWLLRDVSRAFTHQLVRYRIGTSFVQKSLRFAVDEQIKILVPPRLTGVALERYKTGITRAVEAYYDALTAGALAEDARGLLPQHTLTDIFLDVSLRSLASIYTQRMCCQAQPDEWIPVLNQMRIALLDQAAPLAQYLKAPWETGAQSCGYAASFDRPCRVRHLFNRTQPR